MNDDAIPGREELEQITAPPGQSKLAADESIGSALRETWLIFGGLLDRNTPATADVDEAKLRRMVSLRRTEQFHWGRAVMWVGVAVAASVVFALWVMHGIMVRDESSRPTYAAVPESHHSLVSTGRRATRPSVVEVAWDDRMTGRIAELRSGVRQLQAVPVAMSTQASRHDDRVDLLRFRINKFQRAWSANKL